MENEKLDELMKKIDALSLQLNKCKDEIDAMRREIYSVKNTSGKNEPRPSVKKISDTSFTGFENFVGLKLITFVGIVVLIIGLTIGVKYVIDINLISPLMRILLTYAAGVILFFISLVLRKKYQVFSMILFSGSMASVYFTTYAAYEYYALIARTPAFILMLVFTFFTVYNSIKYNRQEIAILGLVGAYGIPFFVKGNAENIIALFGYIFIINFGVLLILFKKYWLSLTYISFFTTWLIYLSWVTIYSTGPSHEKGLLFGYAFFIFFLLASLAFKIIKRLAITANDTFLIITNTVLLYFSLLVLYENSGKISIENITLCFGLVYLAAGIAVKKYLHLQQHLYNGLLSVSITALITFAGIKFMSFTLTLIWVTMAVIMFVFGMLFKIKLFRIGAILLFAATLLKLLFIDSMKFNSIQKVGAYVIMGIVLLVISFLYQKYKKIIFGTEKF